MNYLRTLERGKIGNKRSPSRRQLLKALGVGAAAAPLIPALDGWAQGNAASGPPRLLLLFTPDGIVPDKWYPTGSETAWNFPAGGICEPLNKHKGDMIFFKDIPRFNGGSGGAHEHAMGGLWTGNSISGNQGMAPSVDQIIAQKLPKVTDFQSMQFGVAPFFNAGDANAKSTSVNSYMIYSAPKAKIPAEGDPYKMFDRLFGGGFMAPMAGGSPSAPNPMMERVRAEKQSIIDYVTGEITDVKLRVGKEDGTKIDAHLETVRDIERRLTSSGSKTVSAGCSPGTKPGMIDLNNNSCHPLLMPIVNKMVAAAFACDRTRIASLQYSRGFSNTVHSWVGAKATHHTLSHGTQNAGVLADIQHWYFGHIAQLIDELKAVQEGGKPMLDNMLVVYGNEVYLGWTHGVSPEPTFWMGKLGGMVPNTGRFIDAGGKWNWNQMLTTIARAMGVMVDKVGDLGTPGIIPNLLKA
ncbi:MAG TPA: DUF1552 domain-containing protein [Polyangia bacterium]|nr:DUF1552 domain-containing protein [Polyangia bacterium]